MTSITAAYAKREPGSASVLQEQSITRDGYTLLAPETGSWKERRGHTTQVGEVYRHKKEGESKKSTVSSCPISTSPCKNDFNVKIEVPYPLGQGATVQRHEDGWRTDEETHKKPLRRVGASAFSAVECYWHGEVSGHSAFVGKSKVECDEGQGVDEEEKRRNSNHLKWTRDPLRNLRHLARPFLVQLPSLDNHTDLPASSKAF
ncbi:hypothetical protein BDZ89DRAFT_1036662 [Hymenopellis radicata]|nr:hypothetical protein BDZ89DRAFT_1036662 [Hymenopellis radicata]